MNILFITAEMAPFAKTGGLADVLAALPRTLRRMGHDARVILPLYDTAEPHVAALGPLETVVDSMELRLGGNHYALRVLGRPATEREPALWFVRCPALYARGAIHTNDRDEHLRVLALTWAALLTCQRAGFAPDILHCNDWHTGLLPLTLKARFSWDRLFARARTLLTIHNLNYQGSFPASAIRDTNLADSAHLFHQERLRAGRINMLVQGILYADGVSTVSPTYAREIQTPEHGAGVDALLRARRSTVVGVLNGVDYEEWSPAVDKHIPHRYDAATIDDKERNKQALLHASGLPYRPGVPLLGIVSRLASQKGFDLVGAVMPALLRRHDVQLVVLGSGEPRYQAMFGRLAHAFPHKVHFHRGFSNPMAHLIEAGADLFLMPSRYEPCGLNQMYSLRYGTPPIVHKTGGLADTVTPFDARRDEGTGFSFEHHTAAGLRWAIESALAAYRDRDAFRRLRLRGMAEDFSWDAQARIYEQLYARLQA